MAFVQSGNLKNALQDCSKAIDLNSRISAYWEARGIVHHRQKDLQLAMSDYAQAVTLDAGNENALYGRGLVRRAAGDKTGGDADVAAARKINPDVAKTMAMFGIKD
jgi:tetratricopeptide (TPR) repeat protein